MNQYFKKITKIKLLKKPDKAKFFRDKLYKMSKSMMENA